MIERPPTTDKNGREIMAGDTLKMFHFIGPRRKRYFMYKFVRDNPSGYMQDFFRVYHLDIKDSYYQLQKDGKQHDDIEIVQGYSNGVSFEDRPKIRR